MPSAQKVIAEPSSVFREEFDDWALLFNPETGEVYGLNPVAACIRKHMDGTRTINDFVDLVRGLFEEVPPELERDVAAFIDELVTKGFAAYQET